MYILNELKLLYSSLLFSYGLPEGSSLVTTEVGFSLEDKKVYDGFLSKLEGNQKNKFETWFNSLDDGKQKDFINYIPKIGDNLDSFLEKLGNLSAGIDERKSLFDQYREKFHGNDKFLARIDEIEEEIQGFLEPYIKYNKDYTSLLKSLFSTNGDSYDPEYSKVLEALSQKIHDIEMRKNRIGVLEIELQTMEDNIQVAQREQLLYGDNGSFKLLEEVNSKEESELSDTEKDLKNALNGKNFDELTAGDFYALRNSGYDLSKLLLVKQNGSSYESVSKDNMSKGDSFVVNYGANKYLDKIVGAGDILDITNVNSIKVNGVEGTRKANPRPGYYTSEGHYLAIHDGYKIEITDISTLEGQELVDLNQSAQNRFEQIRGQDIMAYLQGSIDKVEIIPNGERLTLPFRTSGDIKYLKENFLNKLPDFYKDKIFFNEETGSLDTTLGVSFDEILEITKGYSNIRNNLAKFVKARGYSLDSKRLLINDFDTILGDTLGPKIISSKRKSDFIIGAIISFIPETDRGLGKISFYNSNISLDLGDSKLTIGSIFSEYEYNGNKNLHEQYMDEINEAAAKFGVPSGAIIQLIYHENRGWNPRIKAIGSSAYGLGQMIDDTWDVFGHGLDRHNPRDQLISTAKYMKHIKTIKGCSWQEVLAYYNTGPGILSGRVDLDEYYRLNTPIVRKIPSGTPRSNEAYFTGAIAYYNDITYQEASNIINS